MKVSKLKSNTSRILILFVTILLVSCAHGLAVTTDNFQVISINEIDHIANTATLEFDQLISYYVSEGDSLYVILLYENSAGLNGAVILEITDQNQEKGKYAFANPISEAHSWFDTDDSMIEIADNNIFVDFQEYNIRNGNPTTIKYLALTGSTDIDTFISEFQSTILIYEDDFQSSPIQTSSTVTTKQTTKVDDPLANIFGFEIISIFLSLLGFNYFFKRKKQY